jgi:hypothetical protein
MKETLLNETYRNTEGANICWFLNMFDKLKTILVNIIFDSL